MSHSPIDITRSQSFQNVSHWLKELRDHADDNIVIMLVGNKSDLANNRAVSTEEASQFAQENGFLFMETSALTAQNVEPAFNTIFEEIYKIIPKKKVMAQHEMNNSPNPGHTIHLRAQPRPSVDSDEEKVKKNGGCC